MAETPNTTLTSPRQQSRNTAHLLWGLLIVSIILNIGIWTAYRSQRAGWLNVPPVPSTLGLATITMGDEQFAYRAISVMLQNLGDTGGESRVLIEYDYIKLAQWFNLAEKLDEYSNFIPFLAAYYYGATKDPEQHRALVKYLRKAGKKPYGEKWRWLAHAVYLARYKVKDLDLAYEIALELSSLADVAEYDMPNWTRQMPAFIMQDRGEKEAAYAIMLEILKSRAQDLHPSEVNHTKAYICEQILTTEEASTNPLCANVK